MTRKKFESPHKPLRNQLTTTVVLERSISKRVSTKLQLMSVSKSTNL